MDHPDEGRSTLLHNFRHRRRGHHLPSARMVSTMSAAGQQAQAGLRLLSRALDPIWPIRTSRRRFNLPHERFRNQTAAHPLPRQGRHARARLQALQRRSPSTNATSMSSDEFIFPVYQLSVASRLYDKCRASPLSLSIFSRTSYEPLRFCSNVSTLHKKLSRIYVTFPVDQP